MSGKVVLAYSGGLDTSVAIKWLAQEYGLGTYAGVEVVGTPVHLAMKHFDPVPRDKRFPSYYAQNVGW